MSDPFDRDERWMRLALSLAERGEGRCWPNPSVGCVIVKNGRLCASARTADGGRPHAERIALNALGAPGAPGGGAEGATLYTTLEPCVHQGQTPPCVNAIVDAGVARVVLASPDADPRVSGRGIAQMRAAGLSVRIGLMEREARRQLAGFFSRITRGRPHVALKLAVSLDGKIATAAGESRWITDMQARARAHRLRAFHDAVLIGVGTALADDPLCNVRLPGLAHRAPVRIVADTHLRLPLESRLVSGATRQPLWILHGKERVDCARMAALEARGAVCIETTESEGDGPLAMHPALQELGRRGINRLLCEGGSTLAAGLLRAGLVDEIIRFSGGKILGAEGLPAIGPCGWAKLADAPAFTPDPTAPVGGDLMESWRPC